MRRLRVDFCGSEERRRVATTISACNSRSQVPSPAGRRLSHNGVPGEGRRTIQAVTNTDNGAGRVGFDWAALAAALAEPEYFSALWALDPYELRRQWVALEDNSHHRLVGVYAPVIGCPEAALAYGRGLPLLLLECRHLDEAEALLVGRVAQLRGCSDLDLGALQTALGDLVSLDFPPAPRELVDERVQICREIGDLDGLQEALRDWAIVRWYDSCGADDYGGEQDARQLLREQRRICRDTNNLKGLQRWAATKAWMLACEGYPSPVLRLLALQERLCREIGALDELGECLVEQANRLRTDPENRPAAWACLEEAEAIFRVTSSRWRLRIALAKQGILALLEGDEDRAVTLLERARPEGERAEGERNESPIEFELFVHVDMAFACGSRHQGEGEGFWALVERIARRLGNRGDIQYAVGKQAEAIAATDPHKALILATERETICRDFGSLRSLQDALGQRAQLLVACGEPAAALELLSEQATICRDDNTEWRLPDVRRARRDALRAALRGCSDLEAAVVLYRDIEQTCRELGDRASAQAAARGWTRVMRKLGRATGASVGKDSLQLSLDC